MKKIKCKLCEVEKTEDILFHTHHVKHRKDGGDNSKDNLIEICNDCHFDIHHPDRTDGELMKELEPMYKEVIMQNIFADGYAVIPNRILNNNDLHPFSIRLYGILSSLCANKGYCWATNEYLAEFCSVSKRTIARAISDLDPFIMIRNKMSPKRQIWVHVLGDVKPRVIERVSAKKPAKVKKEKVVKYNAQDLQLAEYLLSKIIYNYPVYENKPVNINEWADDMRLLREVEKATFDQVYFMITWLHGGEIIRDGKQPRFFAPHNFWSKNIMSAKKLRKQWLENLIPQLQSELKKKSEVQL